jgi:hypothetical protein
MFQTQVELILFFWCRTALHIEELGVHALNINLGTETNTTGPDKPQEWTIIDWLATADTVS